MDTQCKHLGMVKEVTPRTDGCEECMQAGDAWVHLRVCLACGHVGCCDESKNKHASGHFKETGHPLIQSYEPGEDWLWCYEDRTVIYPRHEGPVVVHTTTTKEFLRRLPLFSGLAEEDLARLSNMAEPVLIKEGELLIEQGAPGDAMYAIVDGEFEVTKRAGKQDVVLSVRKTGEVVGEMALVEQMPRVASVRALRDSRVLKIQQSTFYDLLAGSPSTVFAVLRTFIERLRSMESLVVQHEKLASLGTLAAGLAHELNNPAAAVRRSADQLREALDEWQRQAVDLEALTFDVEQTEKLHSLRGEIAERTDQPAAMLDPLEQSDREGEVEMWLDDHGVEEAWELAPVLVAFGWSTEDLEEMAETFTEEQLRVVIPWLASGSSAYKLLSEVSSAAQRISDIVKAVKTYTYMDQAPVQQVDIHEGLENTLVILKHKLKAGVEVKREYAADLPRIEAYGSELNQVWTNLIDNAIDAMNGQGEIRLRTYAAGDDVVVEIVDSGPGIPAEVQSRMFEPFFTTKEPGVGTGLGLHIVYNIVVDKHHGQISVSSKPGDTCFQVRLPIKLARE